MILVTDISSGGVDKYIKSLSNIISLVISKKLNLAKLKKSDLTRS